MMNYIVVMALVFVLAMTGCATDNVDVTIGIDSAKEAEGHVVADSTPSNPSAEGENDLDNDNSDVEDTDIPILAENVSLLVDEDWKAISTDDILNDVAMGEFAIVEHNPLVVNIYPFELVIADLDGLFFIDKENTLPLSLPMLVDEFPRDKAGAPAYTIDQPLIDIMTKQILDVLNILYKKDEVTVDDLNYGKPYNVRYESGETEVYSWADGITIATNEYRLVNDVINNSPLDNNIIQMAIDYVGIKYPNVTLTKIYNSLNGELDTYRYTITETTDNVYEDALNRKFSIVNISHFHGSSSVHLVIKKSDMPNVHTKEPIVSYDEVMEYIQNTYDILDESDIHVGIYYSSDIDFGYHVPCYKVYIEIDKESQVMQGLLELHDIHVKDGKIYRVVHIPMSRSSHMRIQRSE